MKLLDLIKNPDLSNWSDQSRKAFDELISSDSSARRYPQYAEKSVKLRNPVGSADFIYYTALIHPSNPDSGPYGGMSFVVFPVEKSPSLVVMGIGTQGLSPDEAILAKPGHARKVRAICSWLNALHGKQLAWAKQDPVRIDEDIPKAVKKEFPAYQKIFEKYGKVIYGFFVPTTDDAKTELAVKAFLDLNFEERGHDVLGAFKKDANEIRSQYMSCLMPDIKVDAVGDLLKKRRYLILEGPPGTGKTRLAEDLIKGAYRGRGMSIQFHPNTTYENFVGGLAPVKSDSNFGFVFAPQKGALMSAIEESRKDQGPYLLHIDEINRADLGKVLGEAVYLLESQTEAASVGVAQRKINLSYDFGGAFGRELYLPDNLHILGTMNSADRSIAILDIAIRRRFGFVKLWPQAKVVEQYGGKLMQEAFQRLTEIFVEYAPEEAFNLLPGHSYFLVKDDGEAKKALHMNLVPLLQEYLIEGYVAGFSDSIRAYLQWLESVTDGP